MSLRFLTVVARLLGLVAIALMASLALASCTVVGEVSQQIDAEQPALVLRSGGQRGCGSTAQLAAKRTRRHFKKLAYAGPGMVCNRFGLRLL